MYTRASFIYNTGIDPIAVTDGNRNMLANAARRAGRTAALSSSRRMAASGSPFAQPQAAAGSSKLSKEEEQRERLKAMEEMMRQKTMREVAAVGASRRPDGVKHVLDLGKEEGAVEAAIAAELGPQYAANYDDDRDEWGGPKGARHLMSSVRVPL